MSETKNDPAPEGVSGPTTTAGRIVVSLLRDGGWLTLPTELWPDVPSAIVAIEAEAVADYIRSVGTPTNTTNAHRGKRIPQEPFVITGEP